MQVTETLSEGLKREIKIVVPAKDMETRMNERLIDAKDKVRLNGFRPGKVPLAHMRKVYGKSIMAELVNEMINEKPTEILSERGEKSATRPQISMTEDEAEANEILDAKADFEFSMSYEVIPQFEVGDVSKLKLERQVVDIAEDEVEEQVKRVAESARTYETKSGKAADGDRVTMDYVGKVDGEPFEGGADNDANLVLGSGTFIPGFEDQLVGVKAGDEKTIKVTFPEDYQAAHLAGKEATFDVTVKEVAAAGELVIDDELAKTLGLESAERLREVVREQIEGQYGQFTRQKIKRQILDALDEEYQFETPEGLRDVEFNNIWGQISADLEQSGKTFEDEDTTEEEAREDYGKLAERRVRLGLVLSQIGESAEIQVTDEEMQRAVYDQVRQYPGQEQQVMEYFQKTPDAVAQLRAPIFEEKVIDHIIASADVTDKTVSKEELMAEDDEDAKAEAKPAKKKAAPKKKAAASKTTEEKKAPAKKAPAKKKVPAKKADAE
ncbi:trigger factor [Hoeflea prorocentri]|uniref:Trigger factor n=1 Tax=Hoeflea prorocentri TaxID=1922333 RepID=A0A9X3UH91_9HYPH|nr:trigger factor [Hoeflea prorocentri]MCY6380606.1 trigger factor [Hoeflea prorocentri]MDA5398406.1 trigger factor [Hoeflea prorocentri]